MHWVQATTLVELMHPLLGASAPNSASRRRNVVTDWLSVEVKTRRALPGWLRDAIAQTKGNAGIAQLPIVVLHQTGTKHTGDIVCLSLADFEQWIGESLDD